jgi:type IV secretory pathway TrbL component
MFLHKVKKIFVVCYLMFCFAPFLGIPPFDFLAHAVITNINGQEVDVLTNPDGSQYYVVDSSDGVQTIVNLDSNGNVADAPSPQSMCGQSSVTPADDGGIFTSFQNVIKSTALQGMNALTGAASPIMGVLVALITIDLIMLSSRGALGHHLTVHDILWRVIKWGIFVYFVANWKASINQIYSGFMQISQLISGDSSSNPIIENPSSVFASAKQAIAPISTLACSSEVSFSDVVNLSVGSIATKLLLLPLVSIILTLCIYALFFFLALSSISAQCTFWLTAAFAPLFFPFMLFPQTEMFSADVPKAIFSGAMRICLLNFVLQFGSKIILNVTTPMLANSQNVTITTVTWYACIILLYCYVANKIPGAVTKAITGHEGGGMGLANSAGSAMRSVAKGAAS